MLNKRTTAVLVVLAVAAALALPMVASADYARGVGAQFSARCNPSVYVEGYPSISHGDQLVLPLPWLRALDVTSGWDSQTVDYTAYLFRWNGSAWTYTGTSDSATYRVAEWGPVSDLASRSDDFALAAGPGYYAVAVSYRWVSNQTGALVNNLYYWAPTTEADGSDASYCTFNA